MMVILSILMGLWGMGLLWDAFGDQSVDFCRRVFFNFLRFLKSCRQKRVIRRQWPDAVQLLASAVQAGFSIEGALDVMVHGSPDPLRAHWVQKISGASGWLPFEARVRLLFDDPGLSLIQATLLMAHESGGRAADIIEASARLMRKKMELKEKTNVLTAQGRLTAWIVGLSPLGMLVALQVFAPDLVQPLFTTRAGGMILALAALLVATGLFIAHRIVRIEA
ncbi:MAG: type II secretion system F family protein [Elusimicrobia bacterium]|nr:type II secretion system F family protein [Candidatus Obscuribacterium magneticum]